MKMYVVVNGATGDKVQAVALTLEQAEKARDDFYAKNFLACLYIKEYEINNDHYCDVTKPYDPIKRLR
jgi:hypothetical protein